MSKCPIGCDKKKIEFPALPETEFNEVVISVTNLSQKEQLIEIVPPNPKVSGLTINPLVCSLKPGGGSLVSIKYDSKFRDLTYKVMEDLLKPQVLANTSVAGLVTQNKKL